MTDDPEGFEGLRIRIEHHVATDGNNFPLPFKHSTHSLSECIECGHEFDPDEDFDVGLTGSFEEGFLAWAKCHDCLGEEGEYLSPTARRGDKSE